MITEDYVSFEIAKLLKEKGFDIPLNYYYNSDGRKWYVTTSYDWNQTTGDFPYYSCPTLQMAMKWLREVHHLTIDIFHFRDWKVNIKTTDDYLKADYDNPELKPSEAYEEATESAIKYCLENLI